MHWPTSNDSPTPRPSSVGSTQSSGNVSTRASSSRCKNDVCVGEELKIAVNIALERFRLSEEQKGWRLNLYNRTLQTLPCLRNSFRISPAAAVCSSKWCSILCRARISVIFYIDRASLRAQAMSVVWSQIEEQGVIQFLKKSLHILLEIQFNLWSVCVDLSDL